MNLKLDSKGLKNTEINITGSKSESNRLLILQALFPNITVENLSNSDDTKVLHNALKQKKGTIDIHHAGTAMRFLTAYYALIEDSNITLTGSKRMQERPVSILVNALNNLGTEITYEKSDGFPPLKIIGKSIAVSEVTLNANVSSQYVSALMLMAPSLQNGLTINLRGRITSIPYIKMTLNLLKQIGVSSIFKDNTIKIEQAPHVEKQSVVVESDWSSASYYYSLAALSKKGDISLSSYKKDSLQGDSKLNELYSVFGVETTFENHHIRLKKISKPLQKHIALDLSNTPDLAQTIAVTCFGLGLSCKLTGLHTLKIKETDRLEALKTELRKFGAVVITSEDHLELKPSPNFRPNIAIDTYNDHRMAMAFAPLALKKPLVINNSEVVSKSYPDFWKDLKTIGITTSEV